MEIATPLWRQSRPMAAVGKFFARYGIVGSSPVLDDMIRHIDLVASTRSTVLITGETGPARSSLPGRCTAAVRSGPCPL